MTDKIIKLKDVLDKRAAEIQAKGVFSREEAQKVVDSGRKALSFGDHYDRLTLRLMDACMSIYDEDTHNFIYEVVDGVATNFNVERAKECRTRVALAFESFVETLDEEIKQNGVIG